MWTVQCMEGISGGGGWVTSMPCKSPTCRARPTKITSFLKVTTSNICVKYETAEIRNLSVTEQKHGKYMKNDTFRPAKAIQA